MTENTSALDALAERINNGHRAYVATMRKAVEHALDTGEALRLVKDPEAAVTHLNRLLTRLKLDPVTEYWG